MPVVKVNKQAEKGPARKNLHKGKGVCLPKSKSQRSRARATNPERKGSTDAKYKNTEQLKNPKRSSQGKENREHASETRGEKL